MSNLSRMYALNHDQVVELIMAIGKTNWVHVQGLKGVGKTTLLQMLAKLLPTHEPRYVDTTMLEAGDLAIPRFKDAEEGDSVSFVANESLGLHLNKPLIILLDELPKASPTVKTPCMRLGLERMFAQYKLHEDSIVISTGNLGVEKLGDLLPAHALNRMTVVELRSPTGQEWLENYAVPNNLEPIVSGWVYENKNKVFQDFRDVEDPENNTFIDHPRATDRVACTTPRSVTKAAFIVQNRANMDDQTLTAALIGTIGYSAATALMTFIRLADQLPTLDSIKQSPDSAMIPTAGPARCMVITRMLSDIDSKCVDAYVTYLNRLDQDEKGLFAHAVRNPKNPNRSMISKNANWTKFCAENGWMFAADKV